MAKYLGWAWKPDTQTLQAEAAGKVKKKRRRKGKRASKRDILCSAPSEVFYFSPQWRALRKKVLLKYGCKCMKCDAVDTEIHVDHIKPRSRYPWLALTFSNLQVLCKDCNMEKSNRNKNDYRHSAMVREIELKIVAKAREHI